MEQLSEVVARVLNMTYLLLIIVALDLLGGVLLAVKNGEFKWEKLPEFLIKFIGYLWAWLTMEIAEIAPIFLGLQISGYSEIIAAMIPSGIYSLVLFKYLSGIITNVNAFLDPDNNVLERIGF